MRKAKESDYFIELPSVGTFRFGRKTFQDRLDIRANYLKEVKTLDAVNDLELSAYAAILSSYPIIMVECPPGWEDIASMVLTDEIDDQIFQLYERLREEEDTFRQGAGKTVSSSGKGIEPDLPILAEAEVQPSTN